ncbi:MAG: glycosyltransferase [Acetobacteraceae bacterium]|nr:glycosyltransferase [Acetobacteraceae bacterium]
MAAHRPLRVLHAYKTYLPETEGGIPAAIRSLAAGLSPGCESRVLATRRPGAPRQVRVDGVAVDRALALGSALSLPLAPLYPLRLRALARGADLLALHAPFPLADLGVLAGLPKGLPLVVHWHAEIVGRRLARALVAPAIRATLARAGRIVVSHPAIVEASPWLSPLRGKCRVVPYGVDAEAWATLPPEDAPIVQALRQERPRLVVAVGRLVPYKGFEGLIEAFATVRGQLAIVGEGPLRPRLAARIAALGLSGRVELAGRLERPALRRLLHAARVFAFPSVSVAEAFGIAQLEAMACGLPVVNTALPTAVPWVARDGREGLTVPPGDPGALAVAISALLDDPPRAEALGAAARERVRRDFSEAGFCAGVLAVWQEALAAAAGGG